MKEYLRNTIFFILVLFLVIFQLPMSASAGVLLENTIWEGDVLVEEDVVIPKGITLTVKKNTIVSVTSSDSTKTDPEYMSPLAEITVRGTLVVEGESSGPVLFRSESDKPGAGSWSGIIVDGGTAKIRYCTIQNGESGVWIIGGRLDLQNSTLTSNRYGLVAQAQESEVNLIDSKVTENEYGLVTLNGAKITRKNSRILGNDRLEFHSRVDLVHTLQLKSYEPEIREIKPRELGDEVLAGDTVWEGYIIINGRVRVPVDSRLIILPGTIVEFRKKDTNGDGIGENGLMLQGVLIAKGTSENPILFRSAEIVGKKGDWDAINVINSDGVRNIIEYCQFEDAYRGLHFHFSNVAIQHSVFRNNYRGIQFQESNVELKNNFFHSNRSGIQARDSEIIFAGNQVLKNVFGANFLRSHLTIQDNSFDSNLDFGLKVREGYPTVSRNIFHNNRYGLMYSDTSYGKTINNLMLQNGETGLSIRSGANMEIDGNFIQSNGLSGISAKNSMAVIKGNHISENGERGIGLISFLGPVTDNILLNNYLYAIAAEDGADVTAPHNWYGLADVESVIFDKQDEPDRGRIRYKPVATRQPLFEWPMDTVPISLKWNGEITVSGDVTVPSDTALNIEPGAKVLFRKDTGLHVHGRLMAPGKKERRIIFTSASGNEPGSWGEIQIENALDSRISNADFEYASWGIHSHFTALKVTGCTFTNNEGGIRFRSGPLLIKNSLFSDNRIGLRSYMGKAEIRGNIVTRNDKGIFVREKGGGLLITRNNIYDNADYNVWVGDFNQEDIPAPENWWGEGDPVDKFFDARREPGIGTVLFEPALEEPLDISIEDRKQ